MPPFPTPFVIPSEAGRFVHGTPGEEQPGRARLQPCQFCLTPTMSSRAKRDVSSTERPVKNGREGHGFSRANLPHFSCHPERSRIIRLRMILRSRGICSCFRQRENQKQPQRLKPHPFCRHSARVKLVPFPFLSQTCPHVELRPASPTTNALRS